MLRASHEQQPGILITPYYERFNSVHLTPLTSEDLVELGEADPSACKFLTVRDGVVASNSDLSYRMLQGDPGYSWSVRVLESGHESRPVGIARVSLLPFNLPSIGTILYRDADLGKGIGSSTLAGLTQFSHKVIRAEAVTANAIEKNERCFRALDGLGFTHIDTSERKVPYGWDSAIGHLMTFAAFNPERVPDHSVASRLFELVGGREMLQAHADAMARYDIEIS